jgi:hypothetical protein
MGQRLKSPCTHIHVRTAELLVTDRPHELLIPPPSHLESVDEPEGSAEDFDKRFLKTCLVDLPLTWINGLAPIYASLVKGLHESGAT